MTDERNANTFLAGCRAAISTIRGMDMTRDAMSQAGTPLPANPERENEHLRELVECFIDLDRELSNAGRLPQEWTAERTIVLVIRDPDEPNQFIGEGEPAGLFDVDLGWMNLHDPVERAEWLENQRDMVNLLKERGSVMCSAALEGVIAVVESRAMPPRPDAFDRDWPEIADEELCVVCGQPDNCGDCNHRQLTGEDVAVLKGDA